MRNNGEMRSCMYIGVNVCGRDVGAKRGEIARAKQFGIIKRVYV